MEIVILIIWLVVAFAVADAGGKREIGYGGALVLSLLLSPLLGLIFVAISPLKKVGNDIITDSKQFILNKQNLTGKIDLLVVKSYAGGRNIKIDNEAELLLLARRMFDSTFDNAQMVDVLPPNSDGYLEFVYKRK